MVFLLRVASALVFAVGVAALHVSVQIESYALLTFGILVATAGIAWLVFGGGMRLRAPAHVPVIHR